VRALRGISHVAMSVPVGTLTEEFRAEVLRFYGGFFGWSQRGVDRHELGDGVGQFDDLEIPDFDELAVRGEFVARRRLDVYVDSYARRTFVKSSLRAWFLY
jgi:hypothetical protein